MLRVVTDGGAAAVEAWLRDALRARPEAERWVVSAVRMRSQWLLTFLEAPSERLREAAWFGPGEGLHAAIVSMLADAGYGGCRPAA